MKKYSTIALSALLALSLGVTGCGKKPDSKPADAVQPAKSGDAKKEVSGNKATEKLNAYADGHNSMMRGNWGISKTYESFQKRMLKAKASDNLSYPTVSGLNNAVESFKKGLAMGSSGMDDLDAAVKEVVDSGSKLLAQEKEMEPYFKSKAYKEDNLAKAKAIFPAVQANYESTIAGMKKVDDLLNKYQRAASEKRLAQFKSSGDMVRYNTEQSMLLAQDLLAIFDNPETAIKQADSYTKGDPIIAKLEASLAEQRKAVEGAKAKGTSVSYFDSVNSSLTSLVGNYRELREKKKPNAYNDMMKKYNDAVDNYNRAGRFNRR